MAMPFRVPHIMKVHKSNKSPANMLFFDTETHEDTRVKKFLLSRQVLNFGYAYHTRYREGQLIRERWCRFTTATEFYKFLKSATEKDVPLYCFAHNLGFDLTILDFWLWAERTKFNVDYFVESDPPTFIVGKLDNRKVVFIDTLNYWRASLEKIGESIGVNKLERPTKKSSKAYWDKYAKQDVVVLEAAVRNLIDYLKLNDLGQFGLSAASLAMSSYKHRFMKYPIYIHDNRHAMQAERSAYFGGLTDCFYVGTVENKTLHKLDVNSMYPYCMLGKFPTKLLNYDENPEPWEVARRMRTQGAVAKVLIVSSKHTYPVRHKDRLCYCNGSFTTYLVGPELQRAIENSDIGKIHRVNYYHMEPIFKEYVEFFWKERQRYKKEGNEVAQYFVKIFMNSLYGKFGQLGYDSQLLTTKKLEEIYTLYGKNYPDCYKNPTALLNAVYGETDWTPLGLGRNLTIRRVNEHIRVKIPSGEHNESFPAIAAYVTAYARCYLWQLIQCAGERHCYYVDTDSLIVDSVGLRNLSNKHHLDNRQLGKLKVEGQSQYSFFNAPKDYLFGKDRVQKGIRKDAELIDTNTYGQIQFEGIKSILRRGAEPYIDIKTITKHVSRKYNKGRVTNTGWVTPFTLNEALDSLELF